MTNTVLNLTRNFVNLFYPLHCAGCKKALDPSESQGVCALCISKIRRNPKSSCPSCEHKVKFYFDNAYSACLYEGVLKELIHLFKYKNKVSLSGVLSRLMIEFIKENPDVIDGMDIVTAVPLQARRLKAREFNQSKVLASGIAKEFGLDITDTLEKTKLTKNQNELSREERLVNLKGAFRIRKGAQVKGRAILLVDDVMTTGATLNECAHTLKGAGAERVRCLTLARGL